MGRTHGLGRIDQKMQDQDELRHQEKFMEIATAFHERQLLPEGARIQGK